MVPINVFSFQLTILHAAKMLQEFYSKKIFPRKTSFSEEDYWEDNQLKFRDWRGTVMAIEGIQV